MSDRPAPSNPAPKLAGSRATSRAVLVASLLAALGLAYGAGRLQASGRITAADARARAASASATARSWELDQAEQRLGAFEARRQMHLAELALDARNFGIAEGHLHTAGALLSRGERKPELAELGTRLTSAQLKATEDVGAERQRIAGWIKRFDELVPPAALPSSP